MYVYFIEIYIIMRVVSLCVSYVFIVNEVVEKEGIYESSFEVNK